VLKPLNREDNAKRDYVESCCPDSEVAEPNLGVIGYLDRELDEDIGDNDCEENLED
jgi:hypothetical protein